MGETFEIKGLEELNAKLKEVAAGHLLYAGDALRAEAEIIMTEAKRRTPVDTGALRESGHVTGPSGMNQEVKLVFGGPSADYALAVHEVLGVHHPVGQAKFLESAVLEAAKDLVARVAARMKL